ncbi:carnosine N-methyltransferase-like [Tigriopus californicus]|uniref:carnosine N-methyltransferase-like n=1 Tax=Tigriopus californicus TaxID=6832 RepID=UPI0027DA0E6B|nr:carnosine N-methyltransferase-like [Tigriopus californicus]
MDVDQRTCRTNTEEEEKAHFKRILNALQAYKNDSMTRLSRTRHHFSQLPAHQHALLTQLAYPSQLDRLAELIDQNHQVITEMIADAASMFLNVDPDPELVPRGKSSQVSTRPEDIEKIHSTLKQFARDWSQEGAKERQQAYMPIIEELQEAFPEKRGVKILVPGAGLGRLAFDIAQAGFDCQGNEFSLFMLFASNFVLNKCRTVECYTIYPWIHNFTNNMSMQDMGQAVSFPDVNPNEIPDEVNFSMTAGDFLDVYSDPEYRESQDCVATCFFLDCANNILDFIELIHKILKPGGRWINLGPLLYHFSDIPGEFSIEPSYDIVKGAIQSSGFEFLKEKTGVKANYTQNVQSMLQYEYRCVFFHCKKTAK